VNAFLRGFFGALFEPWFRHANDFMGTCAACAGFGIAGLLLGERLTVWDGALIALFGAVVCAIVGLLRGERL